MMHPSLQIKLGQQLTMTPQLQQAIRLLQLSSLELRQEIQTALETNSMLELDEQEDSEPYLEPLESKTPSNLSDIFHHNLSLIETLNGTTLSLQDHLIEQMALAHFDSKNTFIALALIDSINEDGYLTCSLEEMVATLKQSIKVKYTEVEAVLHRIQEFDPIGVGARSVSECLKIQLDHLPQTTPWQNKARILVTQYLTLLGKRDYQALRRRLAISHAELETVIQLIQSLHPRPGIRFGQKAPECIMPDIFVRKHQGQWQVELNTACSPRLQLNRHYAALIRSADQSSHHPFLRHQLQEARWFLKSIRNRNETLLNVAKCIIKEQYAFLEYGPEAMKPLVLHHISDQLNLHESTISRITTQKYLHTPKGVFKLKYFFSSHVNTNEGGEYSATAIRALIKKWIAKENGKKPLSDSKLSILCAEKGIQIARRTIAKYREGMKIPPANERKRLF